MPRNAYLGVPVWRVDMGEQARVQAQGCSAPTPAWVLQRHQKEAQLELAKSADGSHPTQEAPLSAFITQPKGRRQQAKARGKAAAVAAAEPGTCNPVEPVAQVVVVDVEADQPAEEAPTTSLEAQLQAAEQEVCELEAVGPAAKAAIRGFSEQLGEAVARAEDLRTRLQVERRAAKPLRWQLVEAESKLSSRKLAQEKCRAAQVQLQKEKEQLDARTAENLVDVADADKAVELAEAAVAAVQAEIGAVPHANGLRSEPRECASSMEANVQGMAVQLAAFPTAVAAGNAEAAFGALQEQFAALQRSVACQGHQQDAAPQTAPQEKSPTGPAASSAPPEGVAASSAPEAVPVRGATGSSVGAGARGAAHRWEAGADGRSRSRSHGSSPSRSRAQSREHRIGGWSTDGSSCGSRGRSTESSRLRAAADAPGQQRLPWSSRGRR